MKEKNRVALVTGANRGIGRGIALELARSGADVTVNYRSHAEEAEEVGEEIRRMGRKALVVQADVGERDSVEEMVRRTVEELGRIDIGVANAAYSIRKPFLELTDEDMQQVIEVSLLGVFRTCQATARELVRQGEGGVLLAISSVHAFIPVINSLPYNTCKAGLNHMISSIAAEMAPHRIRVNVLEPGWIDTPGERKYSNEEELQAEGAALPWGRLGTVEEIAKCAAYMCSPDASYLTAANFRVDGGIWLPKPKG